MSRAESLEKEIGKTQDDLSEYSADLDLSRSLL